MYIAELKYNNGQESKTLTYNVRECYASINTYGSNCNMVLPANGDADLEAVAAEGYTVEAISLLNADGSVVYNSTYWNRLDGVNAQFPADGSSRYEIFLVRREAQNTTEAEA